MVYIDLEQDMDKFFDKNSNIPYGMKKIIFKSKCRNGKFLMKKMDTRDYIVLPECNNKALKRLENLAKIRCWKNICVSSNLMKNKDFISFVSQNNLKIMDGKWLFQNMIDQVVEYISDVRSEMVASQEVGILCNNINEVISEKIKDICQKVKLCNIFTNNIMQFRNLEEDVYVNKGIILNVSNNYRKTLAKSNIIINFDFSKDELEKCVFRKNTYLVNINREIKFEKKDFNGKIICFYGIDMPTKYLDYQAELSNFNPSILYESFIYKNTNCKNIKKEIFEDDAKILYLQDSNDKIIKKVDFILPKALDKIII